MMRPTRKALYLMLGGVPVSLLALGEGGLWVLSLAYSAAALALIGVDAVRMPPPSSMRLSVGAPAALPVGVAGDLTLRFDGETITREMALEAVCDIEGDVADEARRPVRAQPSPEASATVPIVGERRGEIVIERVWARWQGPWGLMTRQSRHAVGRTVAVTPDIKGVQAAATQFVVRDAYVGIKVRDELGGGTEFDSLAEYVPGQDPRSVDWKRSARHRKLLIKEYQAERNHDVVLAIDTGHLMTEPLGRSTRLDHAINAGLLLAYLSLRTGDRAGLMGFDARIRRYLAPRPGIRSFPRLLHAAAGLAYTPDETNFTLALSELSTRLDRRSLVVLFTEFVDTITAELMIENLGRLARRHLVLFVTLQDPALRAASETRPASVAMMARAAIAGDMMRERAVVLERIRRLGAHCLDVPDHALATRLIDRYLNIRREELV